MSDLITVIVSAAAAFGTALGVLWLAKKAGLTDIQRELRTEASLLADTLRERVNVLELEQKRLRDEVAMWERRYERLESEYNALKRRLERMEFRDAPG